ARGEFHAGYETAAILAAIGLELADLFPPKIGPTPTTSPGQCRRRPGRDHERQMREPANAIADAIRGEGSVSGVRYRAEREGFDPSLAQAPHRFSRPARSATPAPLRNTNQQHSS